MVSLDSDIGRLLRRSLAIAGVLACSFFTSSAEADRKSYHGAFCQPRFVGHAAALSRHFTGIVNTSSTLERHVTCPLIRDQIGSTSQISSAAVEVNNGGGEFRCTLFSQIEDQGGNPQFDFQNQSTTTVGFDQLSFTSLGTTANNEGSYGLICVMRPNSTIRHVYVSEFDTGD